MTIVIAIAAQQILNIYMLLFFKNLFYKKIYKLEVLFLHDN